MISTISYRSVDENGRDREDEATVKLEAVHPAPACLLYCSLPR